MKRFKDNKEKLQKWRTALQQVADFSGWHFKHGDGYEHVHEFIRKIVKEVSRKIDRVSLPIADYPVGLESRVSHVISLLNVGSEAVHLVGIHGIGGIGKTALALAVFNSIADHFEGSCFLENVRESHEKHGSLYLQQIILLDVLGEKKIKLTSVKKGVSIIQHRLRKKKVLFILGDVCKEEQLNDIIGRPNWFGPGSRVIITTRDKHLLACHGVERTYEVEELKEEDAFELLGWKAFKNDKVSPSYVEILNRVVTYASGLPLALEVIGSNLYGKSIQECESALEQYGRIPDQKIQKILEISFHALQEEERSIFQDIACCFKGYKPDEVENILRTHHDQCIKYHIGVLVDKSLIKINHWGRVALHDLIEDMGKEIVRQESPKVPGKRSRLWSHKDILDVLGENTGTSKIEMIHLDSPLVEEVDWDGEAFKDMKKLKTLIIRKSNFSIGPKYLPNSLRVLEWWKYPLQQLPCDFHPKKLSICKLPESSFLSLELLSSSKKFVTLKVLNLEGCEYLTQIPDLSSLPNLEELSVAFCTNLITTDHSILSSDKLKILDAQGCHQVRSFSLLKLPSLEMLDLCKCSSLESFPEISGMMEHMTKLNLKWSNITKFSPSFQNLTQLRRLEITCLLPSGSLAMMPQLADLCIIEPPEGLLEIEDEAEEKVSSMFLSSNIESLYFATGHLTHGSISSFLSWFPNLKKLSLLGNNFTTLPECIKQCHFLWRLVLDECRQLREIEGIPPRLRHLSARGCKSLSFQSRSMLLKQELHEVGSTDFELPSLETGSIPEWVENQSWGPSPSLSFWFRNNFPRNLLLCLAYPLPSKMYLRKEYFTVNGMVFFYMDFNPKTALGGHTHLRNMLKENFNHNVDEALLENEWNHAKIMFVSKEKNNLDLGIGIHVFKENMIMDDIRFTNPDCEEYFDCESSLSSTGYDVGENEGESSSACSDVEENEEDESSD